MRNLIIADAQDITRLGLKYLTNDIKGIDVVHEITDKNELLKLLSDNSNAMVILDYTLSDFSSLNELQILHERYPQADWLLFSDELSDTFLRDMQANRLPFSIALKSNEVSEIRDAVVSTLVGDQFLCKRVDNHIRTLTRSLQDSLDNHLTTTEREILKEIALGKTTKEIAADRNLSFHTIITHRKNIFRKLEVNNVHEATKYAMRAGIVDVSEYYI
ncbi:response regulator transcription factor [Dysgonomonas macrotermitis]|uniref:DNA-binding response regulator, NarL/FixJ family, contains REC and HTH domains n=1 Tax=Dysgonomonas macrotermitis TaxID=1346286 RepID=A0A1M5CAT3_9BACT|nr:response regulator transcription factor [Dysgonomonas macrotermitis]SHF51874.1 DNA-binding response regulator, NarL/FixJ family, contains REC and HTH domains [Dysgonomonas macrotermitis]